MCVEVGDGGPRRRGPGGERPAGESVDLPRPAWRVRVREHVDQGGAHDAGGADDERDALEGRPLGDLLILALSGLHLSTTTSSC